MPRRDSGGETLVRLSDDEVKSLDPQKVTDLTSLRVAADQFEGLTRYRRDGTIEPGLAHSWTHDRKGMNWRFVLRPDLAFSAGPAISASPFVSLFQRPRVLSAVSFFDLLEHLKPPSH